MENKRLSMVWSERHLPEELWPSILSRLPVRSLLKFRSVSRSWRSLINDPDFRRSHLNNFENNRSETNLLVVEGSEQNCVVRRSDTFETNQEEIVLTLGERNRTENWRVECSIDGLVLLKTLRRRGRSIFHDLSVWNPSIRKFYDIPSLPEIKASTRGSLFDYDIGLGYDPLVKDYKHVKLIFSNNRRDLHSVAIYTLGTASWKIIPFQGNGFSECHWSPGLWDQTVYLRGSLYFLANDVGTDVAEMISVDLSSEVFSCTSLPDKENFRSMFYNGPLALVDGGCSLAAIDFESDPSMYVLESSSMCWTRRYSFSWDFPDFLYVKKSGDVLVQYWCNDMTTDGVATGEEAVKQWVLVSSYNFATEKETILVQEKQECCKIKYIYGYTQSLIML